MSRLMYGYNPMCSNLWVNLEEHQRSRETKRPWEVSEGFQWYKFVQTAGPWCLSSYGREFGQASGQGGRIHGSAREGEV